MSRYILFNKPYGVLSSFTDPGGRPVLKPYIPVEGVYAAGRLDMDSEGLLLLTDDGALIQQLTDPRFHLPKTYWVQVEGEIDEQALEKLQSGVTIQGFRTRRCEARRIPDPGLPPRSKPVVLKRIPSWIEIVLHEGKKRQVRHMTAAVGYPTLRLLRIAIGSIRLGELKEGEWRELTQEEVKSLRSKSAAREIN